MLVDRLKELKKQSGLSAQKISELSNVPLATVNRIFSGATPNPTFQTVVDLCTAFGITVDTLLYPEAGKQENFEHPAQKPLDDRMEQQYERLLSEKERQIEEKERQLIEKDHRIDDIKEISKLKSRWICVLASIVGFLIVFIIVWLVYDVSHADRGWILS